MNKIFGLGLSRTGTTTLVETLKPRGIRLLHNPASRNSLYKLKKWQGANDIPVCAYYKELDKKYPDSKFIYTFREEQSWKDAICRFAKGKEAKSKWAKHIRTVVYGSEDFNEGWYDAHKRHYDDVMEYFKDRPNDLIVVDIVGGENPKKLYNFLKLNNAPAQFGRYNKGSR